MTDQQLLPNSDENSIKLWFAIIYGNLEEFQAAIFARRGLFSKHVYTKDELYGHPCLETIRTMCAQIDNVVRTWQLNQNVSADVVSFYYSNRITLEQRLGSLRAEIVSRKPTLWEVISDTLISIIRIALKVLPAVPSYLLDRFGIKAPATQKFLMDCSREIDEMLDDVFKK